MSYMDAQSVNQSKFYFSCRRNIVSDDADWTSSRRLFQSCGQATENVRSPTVTSREGQTTRNLEVDDRSSSSQHQCVMDNYFES